MPTIGVDEAKSMGIPKKTLQTILLSKDKFNVRSAKKWLKEHNYINTYYRTTPNEIRFMQVFPIEGATYYSKKIDKGNIILVYQTY